MYFFLKPGICNCLLVQDIIKVSLGSKYFKDVDLPEFEGYNNGMLRVSEVFRGEDIYGEINLKTIHRSKIANIAQNM